MKNKEVYIVFVSDIHEGGYIKPVIAFDDKNDAEKYKKEQVEELQLNEISNDDIFYWVESCDFRIKNSLIGILEVSLCMKN